MAPPRKRQSLDRNFTTSVDQDLPESQWVPFIGLPSSDVAQDDFIELDDLGPEINMSADELLVAIAEGNFIELDDLNILDVSANEFRLQSEVIENDYAELNDRPEHEHFINNCVLDNLEELNGIIDHSNLIKNDVRNDILDSNDIIGHPRLMNNHMLDAFRLPDLISGEMEQELCSETQPFPNLISALSCDYDFQTNAEEVTSPTRASTRGTKSDSQTCLPDD